MNDALRTAPASPLTSPRSVHKTHTRRKSGTQVRAAAAMRRPSEDFGLVCHACSTVTIFSADATNPLACSRCGHGLRAPLAG